jgi:hypothetical protein
MRYAPCGIPQMVFRGGLPQAFPFKRLAQSEAPILSIAHHSFRDVVFHQQARSCKRLQRLAPNSPTTKPTNNGLSADTRGSAALSLRLARSLWPHRRPAEGGSRRSRRPPVAGYRSQIPSIVEDPLGRPRLQPTTQVCQATPHAPQHSAGMPARETSRLGGRRKFTRRRAHDDASHHAGIARHADHSDGREGHAATEARHGRTGKRLQRL